MCLKLITLVTGNEDARNLEINKAVEILAIVQSTLARRIQRRYQTILLTCATTTLARTRKMATSSMIANLLTCFLSVIE